MTKTTFNLRHDVSLALARAMIEHPQEDHDVLADAAIAAYRQHPDGAAADQAEIARLVKSRNKWGRKYNETLEKLRLAVMSDEQYVKVIEDKFLKILSDYQNAIACAEKAEAERDAAEREWGLCEQQRVKAYNAGWIAGRDAAAEVADLWATEEQRSYGNGGPKAAIRALTPPESKT